MINLQHCKQLQRLSATARPQEVGIWMKTQKRLPEKVPVVLDAKDYGSKWVQWWTKSQPQARDVRAWPLSKESISDASWWKFPAHGQNGLFLAVMAISWWAPAVKLAGDVAYFEEAVDDLHWVIQELIRTRSSDDPLPQSPLPLQLQPAPHQPQDACQDSLPLPQSVVPSSSGPPPSTSRPPLSSPNSLLPSGAHTQQRGPGKRIVRPPKRMLENSA